MRTYKITRKQADHYNMEPQNTVGIISEGALGYWGQGNTEAEAIENADQECARQGCQFNPDGCWVEIVEETKYPILISEYNYLGCEGVKIKNPHARSEKMDSLKISERDDIDTRPLSQTEKLPQLREMLETLSRKVAERIAGKSERDPEGFFSEAPALVSDEEISGDLARIAEFWGKTAPEYCVQNDGDCSTCSLVNYGRDCRNNPVVR